MSSPWVKVADAMQKDGMSHSCRYVRFSIPEEHYDQSQAGEEHFSLIGIRSQVVESDETIP